MSVVTVARFSANVFFFCPFRSDGNLYFECVNLNSLSNWFTELPEGEVHSYVHLNSMLMIKSTKADLEFTLSLESDI